MDCGEFSAVAAELALGVLAGRERADALAHAEGCDACRETVRRLTLTGEKLVELLPAAEPPAGFETAVMARIGIGAGAAARPRRGWPGLAPGRLLAPRRVLAAAAVMLAVVAAGLGGWGLGASGRPAGGVPGHGGQAAASPLSSAALLSAGRQVIGRVYYYDGADGSRWMYLWLDADSASTMVTCQLQGPGGRLTTVGAFRLNGGYGSWASPVPAAAGRVTGARVVAADGTVLAAARFLRSRGRRGQERPQRAGDIGQRLG